MKLFGVLLSAAILAAGVTGTAAAENTPKANIHARKVRQQKRIGQGVENGSLTAHETAKIERKEANLNKTIAKDRADGGGLTPAERTKIQHRQNKLSREIYREKHDAQTQK